VLLLFCFVKKKKIVFVVGMFKILIKKKYIPSKYTRPCLDCRSPGVKEKRCRSKKPAG
jgi:hypothetical protein